MCSKRAGFGAHWPLLITQEKKITQIWKGYVISPSFWCFRVPPDAEPLPILFVYTTICSSVLNLMARGPVVEASIFFSQFAAGLTNRVPVQDSRAGNPLLSEKNYY